MANEEIHDPDPQIDLSGLEKLSGGDKAIELKYINNFLQSVPQQLDVIEKALADRNANVLYNSLHQLKPQMQFYGLKNVFDVIKSIEEQLRQNREISPTVSESSDLIHKEIKFACTQFEFIKNLL